jgi:hypothetical protein
MNLSDRRGAHSLSYPPSPVSSVHAEPYERSRCHVLPPIPSFRGM